MATISLHTVYAPVVNDSVLTDPRSKKIVDDALFAAILGNINQVLYSEVGSYDTVCKEAKNFLMQIGSNGGWMDLTYTGNVPNTHLERLKTMALAYTYEKSKLYGQTAVYNALVKALEYWYVLNPDHSNWYYDQIAYPQRLGEVLVLMRHGKQKLPADLERKILIRMKEVGGAPDQGGSQGTGANKMNIAMHWIYRGCLTEDLAVLEKGISQAFYPLGQTTGEGLQPDYSYLQHGQQVYIGGYGWDMVNVATRVALYTLGTPYAQGNRNLANLGIFLRQAYLRIIRGKNFMFNAYGRGIARNNEANQSGFATLLKRMKIIEPGYKDVYDKAIARLTERKPASYGVGAKHTHFYRSDYTLQTRPSYTVELRMVSSRTFRNENGNGENMQGYFLADGATAVAVRGDEYENIFPVWDWSMIPGTTTRKGTMVTPRQWGTCGETQFVGGVSDSLYGISVYDMYSNYTQAKKSYFFFEDEVVCLGAGITSQAGNEEVVTTINQNLLQTDVLTSSAGVVDRYSAKNHQLNFNNNLDWVLQGNVGYVLPYGGEIGLSAQPQSGKWSAINKKASSKKLTKEVFTLWFKHGVRPQAERYAYIIVPNIQDATAMKQYLLQGNIHILQNDSTLQAVQHKKLGLYGFVFYDAASKFSKENIEVQVSDPCLLILKEQGKGRFSLHVADPTKKLSKLTIKIKCKGYNNASKEITIPLPTTEEEGGKSVAVDLQLSR